MNKASFLRPKLLLPLSGVIALACIVVLAFTNAKQRQEVARRSAENSLKATKQYIAMINTNSKETARLLMEVNEKSKQLVRNTDWDKPIQAPIYAETKPTESRPPKIDVYDIPACKNLAYLLSRPAVYPFTVSDTDPRESRWIKNWVDNDCEKKLGVTSWDQVPQ